MKFIIQMMDFAGGSVPGVPLGSGIDEESELTQVRICRILNWGTVQLKLQFEDEVLRFSAIDIERNRLFFASSSNLIYTAQLPTPLNAEARSGVFLSAEVEPLDIEPDDFITSFDYLMEKESLIIGTSSGLLLLHMVDSNNTEVVGRLEGGVRSISPSPDGDLLAVTTGLGQLLVLTHDWDVLYEVMFEDPIEGLLQ